MTMAHRLTVHEYFYFKLFGMSRTGLADHLILDLHISVNLQQFLQTGLVVNDLRKLTRFNLGNHDLINEAFDRFHSLIQ